MCVRGSAGVGRDHEGAVAEPLRDVAVAERRLIVGEQDRVRGARGVVDGDEGAVGQVLGGSWRHGADEHLRLGAGPVGDYGRER